MDTRRGSSPRVRGTVDFIVILESCRRFIPACAGNRLDNVIKTGQTPVHPRVCGEQPEQLVSLCMCYGSSPRVRGTAIAHESLLESKRFIPACAGNSLAPASSNALRAVHPRVCGEQFAYSWSNSSLFGSSPRVQGTVSFPSSDADHRRLGAILIWRIFSYRKLLSRIEDLCPG